MSWWRGFVRWLRYSESPLYILLALWAVTAWVWLAEANMRGLL